MTPTIVRRHFIFPLFSLGALMAASACCLVPGAGTPALPASLSESALPTVTGSATYREWMMPPAGSVLKVVLQDTSRADAAAVDLAEWSAPLDAGGVPKAFTLTPNAPLDARLTYTVRATVLGPDAALLWTTDTVLRVPVGAGANLDMGELVMVKVTPYEPPALPLGGGVWIIESIGGMLVNRARPPTITFGEDGRVSGFGGCNRFNGGYTQKGAKVSFTPVMMTMMACAAANTNQLESALGAALQGDATYVVNGDGLLTLTGANGTEITAMQAPELKLAGTSWTVEGMGVVAVVSGSEPGIAFTVDGQINGTTGCNRFFGGYAQDGETVTFTGTGMTKMACMGEGLMAQEAALAAILSGAAKASVDGLGRLTITGANGAWFVAAPVLTAEAARDPALLHGAEWVVEDINRTGVIDNSRLTLMFGEDGRVNGSTNCNRLSGLYAADGGTITFTPLATTRRACLGAALSGQERKYMSALGGEMAWTITADGALELTGDEGRRVLLRR
jgi:putative lipoprotein